MPRPVAILHGWSDKSDSFRPLAEFLRQNGHATVSLFLGDYISLRNDVTLDDVAKRMEQVVREKEKLKAPFDLIVHSTGGLVARRWISMHYAGRTCPVKNLVMLAPANFGSKLAHKGRSMLGRVVKGWKTGLETGEEMLYALELGSPFQWKLAESDLFVPVGATPSAAPTFYAPDRIRPFVIVGTHPYTSLPSLLTNEHGSDGTVRVAAANLNAFGMTVDFSGDPARLLDPQITRWKRRGKRGDRFPLAVLPDRTHGDVKDPEKRGLSKLPEHQARLGKLILDALKVESAPAYAKVTDDWKAISLKTRELAGASPAAQAARDAVFRRKGTPPEHFHEHYQVFIQAVDEFGEHLTDYFVSFMPKEKGGFFGLGRQLPSEAVYFHDEVLEDIHVHRRHRGHRTFFLDRFDVMRSGGFYDQIKADRPKELSFTVTAADPGDRVAYFSRERNLKRGLVLLHQEDKPEQRWLKRHSTHFVRVVVPRAADPKVFELERV